jgi:hypothetical protein
MLKWLQSIDWGAIAGAIDSNVITAGATVVLAIFTVVLVLVTNRQARLARQAIELGNKEFVATHRPRLRIRSIKPLLTDGVGLGIHFIVTIAGETPAHIKHIDTTLWIKDSAGNEFLPETNAAELRSLAGGENALCIIRANDFRNRPDLGIYGGPAPSGEFEFRGWVEYSDDNGIDRRTGFWRIYSAETRRFRAKNDPDYEYEY